MTVGCKWLTLVMATTSGPAVSERLRIRFDGGALTNHRMDVRELGPSLTALADLFAAAHRTLDEGYTQPPALQATATAEGSFAVELFLNYGSSALGEARDLLNSHEAVASATAVTLVGATFGSLRYLVLRFRKGHAGELSHPEPGSLTVTWPDGTVLETTPEAHELANVMDFRRAAKELIRPLEQEGIDSIELSSQRPLPPVRIETHDAQGFEFIEPESDLIAEYVRTVGLRLVSVAFQETHKWRVSDGSATFWASVHDLNFLQRISDNTERFARDDVLLCKVRDRQLRATDGSLAVDHVIEEVIRHVPAVQPQSLPFEPDAEGD